MAKQNDHGLIFEGDVKVRNLNQKGSGFIDIGNTTALTTQTSVETKERVSKQKGTYGSALDSLKTVKPTEIGLKLDTFDKDNLALALMGEAAVIAATAQTVADETVTIGKKGMAYKLANGNIDPVTVKVKNKSKAAVDAAHIDINATLGMITILPAADTVNDGEDITVEYKTRASGGYKVSAATLSRLDLEIRRPQPRCRRGGCPAHPPCRIGSGRQYRLVRRRLQRSRIQRHGGIGFGRDLDLFLHVVQQLKIRAAYADWRVRRSGCPINGKKVV